MNRKNYIAWLAMLISFEIASAQMKQIPFSATMLMDNQAYKKEIRKHLTKVQSEAISPALDSLEFDYKKEIKKVLDGKKDSLISLSVTPSITFSGKIDRIEEISKDIKKMVVKNPADSTYEMQIMLYYTLSGELEAFSSMIVNSDLLGNTNAYPLTWIIRPAYLNSISNTEWKLVKTAAIFYKD